MTRCSALIRHTIKVPSAVECQIPFRVPAVRPAEGSSHALEVVEEAAELLKPARDELIRQAAQGDVVHNDDTA